MMTYCQHLQNFKSNLLLMFLHPPDARMLVIWRMLTTAQIQHSHLLSAWKQCDLIVAERDIVQQLMLKPC